MFGIKTLIRQNTGKRYAKLTDLTEIRLSPIGYLCNHNCPMCWRLAFPENERARLIANEKNSLTIAEYKKLFKEAPQSLKKVEIVGGGEPLLYRKIDELFRLIKVIKLRGSLITNGVSLNQDHINSLVECGFDKVRVSFHAGSSEAYKKINGEDTFETVNRNIVALLKARGNRKYPEVSLFFVIQRDNILEIESFIRHAEKLGIDSIEFSFLTPNTVPDLMIPMNAVPSTIKLLKRLSKKLKLKHNIPATISTLEQYLDWNSPHREKNYYRDRFCDIVQTSLEISSLGLTLPCCFAYGSKEFGTLREKSLKQIWEESKDFRIDMSKGKFSDFCYKYCSNDLAKKTH